MNVLIYPDSATASTATARRIADLLCTRPRAVLGLATGGTMLPVYAALRQELAPGPATFTSFNLDEYVGLPPTHPQSYAHYMRSALFDPLHLPTGRGHLPRGDAPDPAAEAARYDAEITAAGGIDLQLLGLGANGHIGFNEPASPHGSRTRVTTLAQATVAANARFFSATDTVPRKAITMGIATILDAREILLLATGAAKAQAVARMIEGPMTTDCPASALQLHPATTVLLDPTAAAALMRRVSCKVMRPG